MRTHAFRYVNEWSSERHVLLRIKTSKFIDSLPVPKQYNDRRVYDIILRRFACIHQGHSVRKENEFSRE